MHLSLLALIGATLIPMIVGAIWYSKLLFGNSWMRANRFHQEDMKKGKMVLIFGLTLLFSFMLASMLPFLVIHQASLDNIVEGKYASSDSKAWLGAAKRAYGSNFRTFKHGALHGTLAAVFIALPIFGIIALFERRSWRYVLIHLGYWVITLALMGGVLSQWA